jgi:hypothetical protein
MSYNLLKLSLLSLLSQNIKTEFQLRIILYRNIYLFQSINVVIVFFNSNIIKKIILQKLISDLEILIKDLRFVKIALY